ncbi:putative manganese transporter [Veronia pacifica]|uniref:Manganese transporter n=1 Tax=Veronia pacifica TaxID=1080227 RepID=A0A1C3EJX0_9GAMM|nr:putative manganese transporter [Veronia pacifica]ODA33529.1 hypothetical protein A8L45_09975 [Veronia pacifica]
MPETLKKITSQGVNSPLFIIEKRRLLVPAILVALMLAPNTHELVTGVLSDAFWQVASYVAATLALFHFVTERFDKNNQWTKKLAGSQLLQVSFASFMGALPGCGGAIVVVTQYVRGNLSFGSVVAVLTATMGDAAFLLLATRPVDGLMIVALGSVVGWISGMCIDKIHGIDFLRPEYKVQEVDPSEAAAEEKRPIKYIQAKFWQILLLPSFAIALIGSFQLDPNEVFFLPEGTIEYVGAILTVLAVLMWAFNGEITNYQSAVSEDQKTRGSNIFQRVAQDTNFILVWVVGAFLLFELTVFWLNIDLSSVFSGWALLLPLMGVLIGLLPGCGPQILVTSLYVSGVVPMSTQIGNAISNDGDALFPAIALAPKAALVATIYSAIPAMIAAYGYFFLFEAV